jgi:CubicO group peptidase (beta-lactamase class C family)
MMRVSRRQVLQASLGLPAALRGSGASVAATPEPAVWTLDSGRLTADRRVVADVCYVPQLAVPAAGSALEATVRLDKGVLIGLVLNSDSSRGPRYVVGIGPAIVRVFELQWPGKDWHRQTAPISYGKAYTVRLSLSRDGVKSRLRVGIADRPEFDVVLPARLEAFHEPGCFVHDGLGAITSLRVRSAKSDWRTVLPIPKSVPKPKPLATATQARGHEAFGKWLQAVVRDTRRATDVPALACAVVRGKVLIAAAVDGVRRHGGTTPVALADRFHLGSNTKSMTATLLAVFIKRKHLTWETPLEKLLPDLKGGMHPKYRKMPLSFLVHQASGLLDLSEKGLDYGSKGNTLADQRTARAQKVLGVAPAFAPGTKHQYQNINYIVAGAVVDRLPGGEAWEQSIQTNLFAPLGIKTAGSGPMGLPGMDIQPYGHVREKGVLKPVWGDNHPSHGPAGTLHMSVEDFARYAQLHLLAELGTARLLSVPALRVLHRPLNGYGKGWAVGGPDAKGRFDLSHGGSNTMNAADMTIQAGAGSFLLTR